MRLLVIEDEESLRKLIRINLELEGYEVVEVTNGRSARDRIEAEYFDLIILDLMLPGISGMDLLEYIRINKNRIPIIIISAKDSSTDRIRGLKAGADDYLAKPFDTEELLLRVDKLLSRTPGQQVEEENDIYIFGKNRINFRSFEAFHGDTMYNLSPKEIKIMKLLISRKNDVVSRQEILKHVWGFDVYPSTRTIDNFISSLRKIFEKDPKDPDYIISVRGVGYKFVV